MREAGELWGFDGINRFAHGGMLRSAMHIRSEIESLGYLNRLMARKSPGQLNTNPLASSDALDRLNQVGAVLVGNWMWTKDELSFILWLVQSSSFF